MTTHTLFGILFSSIEQLRNQILDDYIAWQMASMEADGRPPDHWVAEKAADFGIPAELARKVIEDASPPKKIIYDFTEVTNMITDGGWEQYLITDPTLSMAEKTKVGSAPDMDWLSSLEDRKSQLNFGDTFIRINKTGPRIAIFAASLVARDESLPYVHYSFFYVDTKRNLMPTQKAKDDHERIPFLKERDTDYSDKIRRQFFQLLAYVELGQIQRQYLPPLGRQTYTMPGSGIANTSDFPVIALHTDWHNVILEPGFDPGGHFIQQRSGTEGQPQKLLWFDKHHQAGIDLHSYSARKTINNRRPRL